MAAVTSTVTAEESSQPDLLPSSTDMPTSTSPTEKRASATSAPSSSSNSNHHKMPSLFSAVWAPHKRQAQEKAKTVARSLSFRDDDATTTATNTNGSQYKEKEKEKPNKRSSILSFVPLGKRGTNATTTTTSSSEGDDHARDNHGHGPQPNRAEQKALKREQKAAAASAAASTGQSQPGTPILNSNGAIASPASPSSHSRSRSRSPTRMDPQTGRPMSPMHAAVAAALLGHGPEHHAGMPQVDRTARYGYLEHSGRGLHLEDGQLMRENLLNIDESRIGERVFFRARIHGTRALSSKLAFLLLRDGLQIIQGVVRAGADTTLTTPAYASPNPTTTTLSSLPLPLPVVSELKAEAHTSTKESTGTTPVQISKRPAIKGTNTQAELGCLVREGDSGVDEQMVRWAEKLPLETLVLVEGRVQSPREDSGGEQAVVRSANVHGAEIEVYRILVLSQVTRRPPFNVAQATYPPINSADLPPPSRAASPHPPAAAAASSAKSISEESQTSDSKGSKGTPGASAPRVGQALVLEHRALGLRTPHAHAIFRLVAAFSRAARSFLDARDFTEIHSAKLQQGASESGASVFHVDYFRRTATLAQSPQLAKEMCIGADFGRVYEIGPVFRAEHSNTHRHLCEFTGLDIEMAIDLDYHEAMDVIDGMLKHMFRTVQKENRKELDAVKAQYPHDDLVFPEKTVVLTFVEGVRMLRESGYMDEGETEETLRENGGEMEDLTTRGEVRLGQLVKEKYNTDYYILDKFPSAVRPFYTMPDADNPKYSNAFDIFVRGEEILSGGQRLHSADALEAALEAHNVDSSTMKEYLEAFQFAMPPHAGGGIGLERLVMLFLKLGNIRNSTLIPRDPRSFPVDPNAPLKAIKLPVPSGITNFDEPNVLSKDPMYKQGIHPRLEDLIASFGDSTNTAWTDKEYEIWRHEPTGFAVGFVDAKHHAVTWGPPLCPPEALSEVVRAYVTWAKNERKLGVIWANADERTESTLVREHNWRALAVTSEQRIMPGKIETMDNKHLEKKIRQAESAGVTVKIVEGPITEELRNELDDGMKAWMEGRTGAQIHTTNLRPWSDAEHRTYFVARNAEKKACGVIVLHQLSPEHGFQIKWSLMFPGAPNGTSELMVTTAMRTMAEAGVKTATFGAGAKETFEAINGIGNIRGRILADVYKGISKTFGLTRKSHFREQFGTAEDSLFICYPPHGLGFSGINAIMESVKSH